MVIAILLGFVIVAVGGAIFYARKQSQINSVVTAVSTAAAEVKKAV